MPRAMPEFTSTGSSTVRGRSKLQKPARTYVGTHVALRRAMSFEEARVEREPMPGTLAERQARLLIQGFVVGESMSAASFAAARERAEEPLMHWAYTELLRDESRHGGFGADAGAWVLTLLPDSFAKTLWPDCVAEMAMMERRVGGPFDDAKLAREQALSTLPQLERLGILRGSVTCEAYHSAIEKWVAPRLTRLGVAVAS